MNVRKTVGVGITLILVLLMNCTNNKSEKIKIDVSLYHTTIDKLNSIITYDVFSPPVASRIYAYPNIAASEVLSSYGDKKENEFYTDKAKLNIPTITPGKNTNKELAALIAFIDVSKELVFSVEDMTVYRDSLYGVWETTNPQEFAASKAYGLYYAKELKAWINKDNYKETRTYPEYNISRNANDVSKWSPTPPSYMDAIEPHWNKIRPFVIDSASQFKPAKHPKFSLQKDSEFYKELMEVYTIKKKIETLGDASEEIDIAKFWDCNPYVSVSKGHYMFAKKKITPGGHWIGICKIACKKSEADFEKTVAAYTKTSVTIADAFISCWDEKYRSNLVRPETLIKEYIDDGWEPILQTPPFPEYSSGHSVVSGAASEILTFIFGDNFSFADDTEVPYGLPVREFSSFYAAANEAAISRLYGGIHYRAAVDEGLQQGKRLGKHIVQKMQP